MSKPQKRILNAVLEIIRFRDTNNELILDSYVIASKLGVEQKKVRDVFSHFRKNLITFLPTKQTKGEYILFDENNPYHQELLAKYVKTSIKHMRTMYFNNVVKYMPIIKDEKLKTEIGQMYLALKGETDE